MAHTHTPEAVFDDDMDRQTATCLGCQTDIERVWIAEDDRLGRWSPWLDVNRPANVRSQPTLAVA